MNRGPILAAVTLLPMAAQAFNLTRTSDDQSTQWASPRVPYALAATSTIPGLGAATRAAFDSWTKTASSALEGVWIGTATRATGRLLVSTMPSDNMFVGALGVTINAYATGTGAIVGSDILVSGTFRFDGSPGTFDLESLMLHEIGHTIGLAHTCGDRGIASCFDLDQLPQREREKILRAVMAPTISAGEKRRVLTADDQAGAIALYPGDRGDAPVLGAVTANCPSPGWKIAVSPADRTEISLRFEDATTRAVSVTERGAGFVVIAPIAGTADVVAHDPQTRGTAAMVALALDAPDCSVPDAGVIVPPPVDAGGCDCRTTGALEPLALALLALVRRRK